MSRTSYISIYFWKFWRSHFRRNREGILSRQFMCLFDDVILIKLSNNFDTLKPEQNCQYFAVDISKCIFVNQDDIVWTEIPFKYLPNGPNNNRSSNLKVIAWHRIGDMSMALCWDYYMYSSLSFVQGCSIYIANALEILQSCSKPSMSLFPNL